jgi:hypothetical protein
VEAQFQDGGNFFSSAKIYYLVDLFEQLYCYLFCFCNLISKNIGDVEEYDKFRGVQSDFGRKIGSTEIGDFRSEGKV